MIELGGGGEAASRGLSQCTQETDKHIRCGCRSTLRTRRNGLAALISEGNAYALLTSGQIVNHTVGCLPMEGDMWHELIRVVFLTCPIETSVRQSVTSGM